MLDVIWKQLFLTEKRRRSDWLVLETAVSDVKSADLIGCLLKSHYVVIRETYRRHSSSHKHQQQEHKKIEVEEGRREKGEGKRKTFFVLLLVLVLQALTIVD